MREQMAHQWLGFDRGSVEKGFDDAGAESVDDHLTGSRRREMARNGNRPVESLSLALLCPQRRRK